MPPIIMPRLPAGACPLVGAAGSGASSYIRPRRKPEASFT